MKIKISLAALLYLTLSGSQNLSAQTNVIPTGNPLHGNICGTETPGEQWEKQFQELIKQNRGSFPGSKTQDILYTIPVIIHVVHGGQSVGTYPNLAQGQLNSQVQVLNNDYGGIGYNTGNYPATAFTSWAISDSLPGANLDGFGRVKIANCNIQFCMATKDTLGNLLAEPGIERINYTARGWSNPASFNTITALKNFIDGTVKPQTIWNVTKYLNIWVTDNNINANSLLGYATFPRLSTLSGIINSATGTNTTDGFWCYAMAFGSQSLFPSGVYYSGYERGRTSTHEIGHYLGLRHIGGDGNSNPSGDCDATDYCEDTPPQNGGYGTGQYGQNFGSPAYPLFATGASACTAAVDGSMFMNFMDYTDDNSKYMYTPDQSSRIQTAMANSPYRMLLGTHNLCSVSKVAAISHFNIPASVCQSAVVTITNTSSGIPVPTYTWSSNGGAVFSPNINAGVVTVSFPLPGNYAISLTTDNGTVNVVSKTINVIPGPNLIISPGSQTICLGDPVSISASGGDSYVWQPDTVVANEINYIASIDQTFTCVATATNGCETTSVVSMVVSTCTGFEKLNNPAADFKIYPNPAKDFFNLKYNVDSDRMGWLEMQDITGKTVMQQVLNFRAGKNEMHVSISSIENGMYILKIKTEKGDTRFIKVVKE